MLRRLQHRRVAAEHGREDLPGVVRERRVERDDQRRDADGPPHGHDRPVRHRRGRRPTVEAAPLAGDEEPHFDGGVHLAQRELDAPCRSPRRRARPPPRAGSAARARARGRSRRARRACGRPSRAVRAAPPRPPRRRPRVRSAATSQRPRRPRAAASRRSPVRRRRGAAAVRRGSVILRQKNRCVKSAGRMLALVLRWRARLSSARAGVVLVYHRVGGPVSGDQDVEILPAVARPVFERQLRHLAGTTASCRRPRSSTRSARRRRASASPSRSPSTTTSRSTSATRCPRCGQPGSPQRSSSTARPWTRRTRSGGRTSSAQSTAGS